MDGRVQEPVIKYLKKRFKARYVDMITEAGPNKILAEGTDKQLISSIMKRIRISLDKHGAGAIAVIGHYDCAGNPVPAREQSLHTERAVDLLKEEFSHIEITGLWVDEKGRVSVVSPQV